VGGVIFSCRWAAGGGEVGLAGSWSLESKVFEMLVKDGDTGLLIKENRCNDLNFKILI
jgi:hypothetical protein